LGHYINQGYLKRNIYSCARIWLEIDLQKGMPKTIQFNMEGVGNNTERGGESVLSDQ